MPLCEKYAKCKGNKKNEMPQCRKKEHSRIGMLGAVRAGGRAMALARAAAAVASAPHFPRRGLAAGSSPESTLVARVQSALDLSRHEIQRPAAEEKVRHAWDSRERLYVHLVSLL